MSRKSKKSSGIRLTKKVESRYAYAAQPRSQHYRPHGVHKDFQCLVNSPETAEAHKFLKAAAALEGVPMVRLHRLSSSVKRRLKEVVGDNKELSVGQCRQLMDELCYVSKYE